MYQLRVFPIAMIDRKLKLHNAEHCFQLPQNNLNFTFKINIVSVMP